MKLSAAGLELVKCFEGFRASVYLDVAGLPTIGYGHRLLPTQSFPNGVDEQQATEILASDVCEAEQAVSRLVKVSLTQGQFDALVDFTFNLGQGKLGSSTLLHRLNSGDYAGAAAQFPLWMHTGAQESSGLKLRRAAELQLWNS